MVILHWKRAPSCDKGYMFIIDFKFFLVPVYIGITSPLTVCLSVCLIPPPRTHMSVTCQCVGLLKQLTYVFLRTVAFSRACCYFNFWWYLIIIIIIIYHIVSDLCLFPVILIFFGRRFNILLLSHSVNTFFFFSF